MTNSTGKSNSDIVVIPEGSSSVPATRPKRQPKKSSALSVPVDPINPQPVAAPEPIAKRDLISLAIAAADAPFAAATIVFDARYGENFSQFLAHTTTVQSTTAGLVIDKICSHYGVTEDSFYDE